jgi:hypothetical protein
MFSSVPLLSGFTVVFLVTGVYSIIRLAALASGVPSAVDPAAELSHLLMSVAMLAMTWGWTGGPASPSGALQLVVFSLAGLYFLIGALFGDRAPVTGGYHLVMALTMVWMVATAPLLMGSGSTSARAMEDMPWIAAGGSVGAAPVDPAVRSWVLPVSLVLVALLVAAALFWAARAAKQPLGEVEHCAQAGAEAHAGVGARAGRAGTGPWRGDRAARTGRAPAVSSGLGIWVGRRYLGRTSPPRSPGPAHPAARGFGAGPHAAALVARLGRAVGGDRHAVPLGDRPDLVTVRRG